jgi:hypothetical protein
MIQFSRFFGRNTETTTKKKVKAAVERDIPVPRCI